MIRFQPSPPGIHYVIIHIFQFIYVECMVTMHTFVGSYPRVTISWSVIG
jgi:hypothetical protein